MADKDSNTVEFQAQELDHTIRCCICTDVYTDPKALPCIHTFCMKCLQEIGLKSNKVPGDEMLCPICRRQFKIPQNGFCALPNNFFIAKLIQVANVSDSSSAETSLCDACLEDNEETGKKIPIADIYCTDCKQKLCEECCRQHRKFKLNKNHKLTPINEQQVSDDKIMENLAPSACELHAQRVLEIYCVECKTVDCAICFIDGHRHHEGSHVGKFVDGFRKQIENSIETISQCSSRTRMKQQELIKMKEEMQHKVEKLECDVMNRRDEIKQFADTQANSLLQILSLIRQSKLKEMQMEVGDIDTHMSCLQSYSSYCQKILTKGSASDICRTVSDLSVRATELQQHCQSVTEREILPFKFCFAKSEFEKFLEDDNLIGKIEEECNLRQNTTGTNERTTAEKLKQELETEKQRTEFLKAKVDKLEQELECEKTTSKKLQDDNNRLTQKLNTERNAKKPPTGKTKKQANDNCVKTKTEDDGIERPIRIQHYNQQDLPSAANDSLEAELNKTLESDLLMRSSISESTFVSRLGSLGLKDKKVLRDNEVNTPPPTNDNAQILFLPKLAMNWDVIASVSTGSDPADVAGQKGIRAKSRTMATSFRPTVEEPEATGNGRHLGNIQAQDNRHTTDRLGKVKSKDHLLSSSASSVGRLMTQSQLQIQEARKESAVWESISSRGVARGSYRGVARGSYRGVARGSYRAVARGSYPKLAASFACETSLHSIVELTMEKDAD